MIRQIILFDIFFVEIVIFFTTIIFLGQFKLVEFWLVLEGTLIIETKHYWEVLLHNSLLNWNWDFVYIRVQWQLPKEGSLSNSEKCKTSKWFFSDCFNVNSSFFLEFPFLGDYTVFVDANYVCTSFNQSIIGEDNVIRIIEHEQWKVLNVWPYFRIWIGNYTFYNNSLTTIFNWF